MPPWSKFSCAQWIGTLREPAWPLSRMGVRPAASMTGTLSREAAIMAQIVLAVPTLTCTITQLASPVTLE